MSKRWLGLLLLLVIWIGGGGAARADQVLTVTPASPVDFGSVRTDGATATTLTQTFTITNSGTAGSTLVVSDIALANGDGGTDYVITAGGATPISLGRNQSQTVTVQLNPSVVGTRTATLTITSDAGTQVVNLTGTGTSAIIAVTDVNYNTVDDGTTSTQNIAVTNSAAAATRGPLRVASASIVGGSFFSFGSGLGCTAGSTTCTFNPVLVINGGTSSVPVRCAPPALASGTQTATVTFVSDTDPSTSTSSHLSCTAGRPNITVSETALAFGDVPVGQSPTQTFTITNDGTLPLNYSIAENPNLAQYTIGASTGCVSGCTLNPTLASTITVTFTPNTPAAFTTQLDITSNDPDPNDNLIHVPVSGTGRQGILVASLTSFDFGGVAVGATKSQTFTLTNTGNIQVSNLAATVTGAGTGFVFDPATVPSVLAPGTAAQVTLTASFSPTVVADGGTRTIAFGGQWTVGSATTGVTAQTALTGLAAAFEATPGTVTFPDFPFDSLPSRIINVTNTGRAPLTITVPVVFSPDGGTTSGEYEFDVRRPGQTQILNTSATINAGDHLEITAIPRPSNRIGVVSGHITVKANLGPDKTVQLTGTAFSAAITASAPIDFGAVDVQGPFPSMMVAFTNTGAASLGLTSIAPMAGASPAFRVTLPNGMPLPNGVTLASGASLTLTITYTPTAALPANQHDQIVLAAQLSGVAGLSQASITAIGRGIDRNLDVAAVQAFPPTFRNPGALATMQAITVRNTGEAVLAISGVMISGDPVWQLVDGAAITVPGGGSHDFLVKFSPTALGPAPNGQLTIVNDDNARAMARVTLSGSGTLRNVVFDVTAGAPTDVPTIDLGPIGVGVPTTLDDIVAVINQDPSNQFTIHAIQLSDDSVLHLDHAPADLALPAAMTERFGLTFEATTAGAISTTARLYLDQDPEANAEVHIIANAVYVDAHGGGGCDASRGGAGSGSVIALGVVAALGLLGRRRRRRAAALARTESELRSDEGGYRKYSLPAGLAGAVIAGLAGAPAARADGVDVAVFAPTPSTTGTGFQLQSPDVGADGSWVAAATASYASKPLVLEGGSFRNALIERSTLVEPGFAYAYFERFEAGLHIPLYMQSGQASGTTSGGVRTGLSVAPADGTATGNLALHAKARLWRGHVGRAGSLITGASAIVDLPTATKGQFTGSDQPELRVLALAAFTPTALASRLTVSLNTGPIVRGKSEYANIVQQSGLAWGVGASYRVADSVWATGELFGELTPSGKRQAGAAGEMPGTTALSRAEGLAGLTIRAERRFTVGLAIGRGLTDAIGTPELRGVLSLAFVPSSPAVAPMSVASSGAADRDSDGDGIPDSIDKCPNEPEDKDMFEDDDGCPDPDNDHDGIPDALDKCPLDPEDKDGFQDEDGCPDKDNDGDGIPDKFDKCPNEPEDKDGFEDLDGCPDPDNDHDGIPDKLDKCPNEPETINGFQDEDGCPDKGDTTIVLSPDRIETLDPIQFTGVKLTKQSTPLISQVGSTLRAHPEIVRVRITVYVQPSNDAALDQTRSERRAQAVRDWLVQFGIASTRLEIRGFGGTKPLVAPDQRGAARINDRLELIILERK